MSTFAFGKGSEVICFHNLAPAPDGTALCLGYRVEYYGLVLPGYLHDAGYVIDMPQKHQYVPLDDASIAQYQHAGVLPDPMPPYSVPASTYAWGFSLWPLIAVLIVGALLRRRGASRRHAAQVSPMKPGDAGIEVAASHSILHFNLAIAASIIRIDGVEHRRSWGTWTFPVASGHHVVEVGYQWLTERGRERVELDVIAGEIKRVTYHPGFFGTGSIKLDAAAPAARVEREGATPGAGADPGG